MLVKGRLCISIMDSSKQVILGIVIFADALSIIDHLDGQPLHAVAHSVRPASKPLAKNHFGRPIGEHLLRHLPGTLQRVNLPTSRRSSQIGNQTFLPKPENADSRYAPSAKPLCVRLSTPPSA